MNIRIEFDFHKSPQMPFVVRLCKKFPTFKEFDEDGMHLYSIEFTENELPQFQAIHDILYGWPRVAHFLDGKLIPQGDIFKIAAFKRMDDRLNEWIEKRKKTEQVRALMQNNPNDAFLKRLKKYHLFGQES